ncbi:MAG: IclR family transcriptional regulator [Candidatus Eremiobacteraeota bacterium]|nr:IclR family transcriptional regulator [Candidatus Eremiobacteraeota bacterium]
MRRALRVLDYLAEAPGPVPIKQIATGLDINISSSYHLLNTLVIDGYAARDERSGAFGLGPKAARLGPAFARNWPVLPQLREVIRELGARTNENAYLALAAGRDVIISEIVETQQPVRIQGLHQGYSGDLHARALGKAVLAHRDATFVRDHFAAHPPRRCTERTIVDLGAIEAQLGRVRRRGYSEDLEEYCDGVCCIGAPIFAADDTVYGALSVSIPAFRFRRARGTALDAVVAASQAATAALGAIPRSEVD